MDEIAIFNLIADFGFPALVCTALAWFIFWSHKQHREERKEDRKERSEIADKSAAATDKLSEAVVALQITLAEKS